MENHIYLCIDLKTFFASCECAERGLDPFKTNLVVADPSRGEGAICLAITPAMKALGIKNRCRIFEIPKYVKYITALPRMKLYIKYAAKIYSIYLRYISKDDIHPYSIDEMFLDVTSYLKLYKMTETQFARFLMNKIYEELHINATAGIGTNLFLCKVALDITAKKVKSNIGYLDEEKFKRELWNHRPLSDFWQISTGIETRLNKMGIYTLKQVCEAKEEDLYKEFGVNAEILIDHAHGKEPLTIKDIHEYKPKSNSLSQGQVLFSDYTFSSARLVLKEMVELLSLQLVDERLVTSHISLSVGYSKEYNKTTGASIALNMSTNVYSKLLLEFLNLYDNTTIHGLPIRRINISVGNLKSEDFETFDLFTDPQEIIKERNLERTINSIKKKYGKNSILKAMNLVEGATTIKRNKLIGGHNSGEDEIK
ncbi:MAG: DNA repair protein [Bacilli bacterium]|nr:DNA repair protein [Bacilli bacterium]